MGLLSTTGKSSSSKGNPQIGVTVSLAFLGLCIGGLATLGVPGVRGVVPSNPRPPASNHPDI